MHIFKDVWKLVWILFLLLDANILRYLKKKKLWYICFCFSHSKYFVEDNIHIHLYYLHLFQTFTQAAAVSMFEFWRPMISQFFSIHPQGGMAWEFPRGATLENLIFSSKQADCPRDCSGYKVDEYFHVTPPQDCWAVHTFWTLRLRPNIFSIYFFLAVSNSAKPCIIGPWAPPKIQITIWILQWLFCKMFCKEYVNPKKKIQSFLR